MDSRVTDSRGFRYVVFWLVVCIVVAVDQATKAAVRVNLTAGQPVTLIPGVLDLLLVRNTGAAFSIGRAAGPVFVIVAIAAMVAIFVLIVRERDLPMTLVVTLSCVAGGGFGNMIDRVMQGYVTDFLATSFVNFPVFNVADIFVTCGVALSLVGFLVWDHRRAAQMKEAEA